MPVTAVFERAKPTESMFSSSNAVAGRTVVEVASAGRLAYHVDFQVPVPPVVSSMIRSSMVPPVPPVQFVQFTVLAVPTAEEEMLVVGMKMAAWTAAVEKLLGEMVPAQKGWRYER